MKKPHALTLLVAMLALAFVFNSCNQKPGAPPTVSEDGKDAWENLPVVGRHGTGIVDKNGGVILATGGAELHVPRGALRSGQTANIGILRVNFSVANAGSRKDRVRYSKYSWNISYPDRAPIPVRIVLPDEALDRSLPEWRDGNYVLEAVVLDGGFAGADASTANLHVIPAARTLSSGRTYIPLPLAGSGIATVAVRAMAYDSVKKACEEQGGSFYAGPTLQRAFPASLRGYICRPPSGYIWNRANFRMERVADTWPSKGAEGFRLLTANVGGADAIAPAWQGKLTSDVAAQRIVNNLSALKPDIIFFQDLYDGRLQLPVMLPDSYEYIYSSYPNGARYEGIAWKTIMFHRSTEHPGGGTIVGDPLVGERPLVPDEGADDFARDYCAKYEGEKDTGGVWTSLTAKNGVSFKAVSVRTATGGVVHGAYCREEQLLALLQRLGIAVCYNCGSETATPSWQLVPQTAALLAGDFNIDPVKGGAPLHAGIMPPFSFPPYFDFPEPIFSPTKTDRERFRWMADWQNPLGDPGAPATDASIEPRDLNALEALRKDNDPTTRHAAFDASFDHVLATGGLVNSAVCHVLNGTGDRHALDEDWWISDWWAPCNLHIDGMDHYAVACSVELSRPPSDPTMIWADGFESYKTGSFPSKWHVVYSGAGTRQQYVTDKISASGDKSFRVLGRRGWSAVMARTIKSNAPVLGVEYSVYFNGRASNYVDHPGFICETCGSWSSYWGVGFDHGSGEIHLGTASGTLTVGHWNPYEWITIKYVLDRNRKVASVWINGKQVAAEEPLPVSSHDPYSIGGFAVTSAWPAKEVFYDEIRVFSIP